MTELELLTKLQGIGFLRASVRYSLAKFQNQPLFVVEVRCRFSDREVFDDELLPEVEHVFRWDFDLAVYPQAVVPDVQKALILAKAWSDLATLKPERGDGI